MDPDDFTPLVGTTLGLLIVLIPVMGLTFRFTLKPLIDALIRTGVLKTAETQATADGAGSQAIARLERRVLELEQEIAKLKGPKRPELAAVDPGAGEIELAPALERVQ